MKIPIFQVDAFADQLFRGNPAAVCPLDAWLDDEVLQAIAAENNLAETAFYVASDDGYRLRWFTPTTEVDLCGHATLAAAHVLFKGLPAGVQQVEFDTRSGKLRVMRESDCLTLDFPSQVGLRCEAPKALVVGLGVEPLECYRAMDYMAVLNSEAAVRDVKPDFRRLNELDLRGVIITAPGQNVDFVSRFFAPRFGIDEDPVTGSAHCTLAPYWAKRLGRTTLEATQLSKRTGMVRCRVEADRVFLSGKTVEYLEGTIEIPVR